MEKFAELLKIKGLLPVSPAGNFVIEVTEVKGKDFTIKADPKAEINAMALKTVTIESQSLAELGVVAGSTAYLAPAAKDAAEGTDPFSIIYTAPAKQQVAQESAKEGRGRTPNFSTDRARC